MTNPVPLFISRDSDDVPSPCLRRSSTSTSATPQNCENDARFSGSNGRHGSVRNGVPGGEAVFVDRDGSTVLHACCYDGSPPQVVSKVLESSPAISRMMTVRNRWGRTPLHVAVERCSREVVEILLGAADGDGLGALNIPGGIMGPGTTPLEYLCIAFGEDIRRASDLLSSAASTNSKIKKRTEDWHQRGKNSPLNLFSKILAQDKRMRDTWSKACALVWAMTASYSSFCSPKRKRMIHACASLGVECPSNLLNLAVRVFPKQLRERDDMGNLPLHLACAAASRSVNCRLHRRGRSEVRSGLDDKLRALAKTNRLRIIANPYPGAAGVPNVEGRLPLHLSLDGGGVGMRWNEGVDEVLLSSSPSALRVMDMNTHLYPFMAAAVASTKNYGKSGLKVKGTVKDSQFQLQEPCLTTVYRLLRACPELEWFLG